MEERSPLVLGITGLPGSGKSTAAQTAEKMGSRVITGGGIVRNEVEARGLEFTDANSAMVTEDLRNQHGENALAEKCIDLIKEQSYSKVLVDSFRNIEEVNLFRESFGNQFHLIGVKAPFGQRANRLLDRNRSDDIQSLDELRERDTREIGWGVEEVIGEADVVIENSGTLSEFQKRIRVQIQTLLE